MLLGHLQSDALESRFGWLRQLGGANYYISTPQVVEGSNGVGEEVMLNTNLNAESHDGHLAIHNLTLLKFV